MVDLIDDANETYASSRAWNRHPERWKNGGQTSSAGEERGGS
jgi:hypothetical protein